MNLNVDALLIVVAMIALASLAGLGAAWLMVSRDHRMNLTLMNRLRR